MTFGLSPLSSFCTCSSTSSCFDLFLSFPPSFSPSLKHVLLLRDPR
jgi:hypothetical protein